MTAPLRVAIVGCGRLAELGYLPAARRTPAVEVVALADPDRARLDEVTAAAPGARPFRSCEELLAADVAEALVVASPPAEHERAARLAARAGVAALVEKPPAPDLAGARRIAALEPPPFVGFNRRFSLGRGLAGALPAGGAIELELRYRRFSWSPVSVRDPALTDLAPHLLDLALVAGLGEPRAVRASSPRPERVTIVAEGERGSARVRCACDRAHRERVVVRDASGRVVLRRRVGGLAEGLRARLGGAPHPLVASLTAQLGAFAAAVRGAGEAAGDGRLATARDGVRAMRLVAAAAASLARGGASVEPPPLEVAAP